VELQAGGVTAAAWRSSLDGLRAISIGLVMAADASACPGFPAALGAAVQALATGMLGVRVFFVISGFLITTLLMRERAATGRVALGRFYARRSVRILPAYVAFLAGMAIAQRAGWLPPLTEPAVTRAGTHALTFTANYAAVLPWAVRHLWSLSVEEQFYLLWPLVIAAAGVARGARWAAMFAGVTPLVRLTLYAAAPMYLRRIGYTFETAGDAIAVGCLLAVWRDTLWTRAWYRALLGLHWFAAVPALALAMGALMPRQLLSFTVGMSAQTVLVALVIDRAVRCSDGVSGRLLNARPMRAIGVVRY
jgi:peptidoglycan/LPS O-acetylase OafA/YrhL